MTTLVAVFAIISGAGTLTAAISTWIMYHRTNAHSITVELTQSLTGLQREMANVRERLASLETAVRMSKASP